MTFNSSTVVYKHTNTHTHTHTYTQDGIIVLAYAVLWGLTAILNLAFAASIGNVVLGITVVSLTLSLVQVY